MSHVTCHVTRQCVEGGQWTGPPPSCEPIICPDPAALVNGLVELVNGSTRWKVSNCQFSGIFPVCKDNQTNICLPVKHDTINIVYCVWLQAVASYQCLPGFYNYGYGKL